MLQSSLTKHLLKADILFRGEFEIIPVDSGICRCRASDPLFRGCHQSGSLSGVTRERHPTSQSEHLLYAEKFFGIQRYSSLLSGDNKNPRRRISDQSFENPPLRLPEPGRFPVQYYNRFGAKKIHRCGLERSGAVWSGHRNQGISPGCILQHERSVFLFRSLSRYKPHETGNGILNGLKHKTEHTCFTTAKRTFNLKNVVPWIH